MYNLVYLHVNLGGVQSEETVAEREREILFVFLLCVYLPAFLWPRARSFVVPECRRAGREREYSQFPSKKKIHLQLLM